MRWDFSETQSGKGPCDRAAAWVKRKVRLYIDENHPCTNAQEYVRCVSSSGGVKETSIIYSRLDDNGNQLKAKIPGISNYNNFQFGQESIVAWRAYKIGPV